MFLIIKKKKKKKEKKKKKKGKPTLLSPLNLLRLPYGPFPFVRCSSLSFLALRI